jgi:hypothetical protein
MTEQNSIESKPVEYIGGPVADGEVIVTKPDTMVEQMAKFASGKEASLEISEPIKVEPKPAVEQEIWVDQKKYTVADLSREVSEFNKIKAAIQPVAVIEEDLSDIMFTDPKKYTQILKDQAKKELRSEINEDQKRIDIKTRFYNSYQDMRGNEDLVEHYATKMQGDIANDTEEVALSKVAQAVRARVAKIKGSVEATETIHSKIAVTADATGSPTARATLRQEVPKNFVDQMKQAFKRGSVRY